jgi:hypothetical protein
MPSWVLVVLAIVIVLAAGFVYESLRGRALTRWCETRGFRLSERSPDEVAALTALARRFRPKSVARWGHVLRRDEDGLETTIAEHAERPFSSKEKWYTLVAINVSDTRFDTVSIVPAPDQTLRRATDAIVAPARSVQTRLGIEVTTPPPVYPVGDGKWAVDAEDAAVRAFWTHDSQAAAIDQWPHDTALAAVDHYVLVREAGLMDVSRLDGLLERARDARTFFERTSTPRLVE